MSNCLTRREIALATTACALLLASPASAGAQSKKSCHILCAPSFAIWPELHRSHLFNHPRVRNLSTGAVTELPSKNNLLLLFLVSVPTELPRFSLLFNVNWLPTARATENPFTEYTASELGTDLRANLPAVAAGASYQVLTDEQTGGWLDVTPYVDDLLSSAARPEARSDYTHKLETGVTATAGPFAHLSPHSWLHGVRIAGTLDWVVTGLPEAGDEIPKGERVFLDDARGYSASIGITLPVAPIP
ncbi:MAG TPA: hypothetical protein VHL12_04960 [Gemmatimonadaceae bacterium]|nr:hypothetical protein [Gemmatimonadaceae bacterium]